MAAASLRTWASLVKLAHTVFALPFALIALLVASDGRPGLRTLALVVVAMVAARAAAMAYNRLVDADIDARNPRTANREIPRGAVSRGAAAAFVAIAALVFVASAWGLNRLCAALAGPVLAILLGYSHAKRFTALSHLWLGVALGLAPAAAWLAVRGAVDASIVAPLVLGAGVAVWVAGFDVLYACQDHDFDAAHGLHSLPVRLGVPAAMRASRLLHLLAVAGFAAFGWLAGLGAVYYAGVAAAAGFLWFEHRLLAPGDLGRIDAAFFTMNGAVSVALLSCTAADLYS